MRRLPSFVEIKDAVVGEVIAGTNTYTLLVHLGFELENQSLLRDHYPFLIDSLVAGLRGHVLLSVCRLFETDKTRRHSCLVNFLSQVQAHHAQDTGVPADVALCRREYEGHIPGFILEIERRWRRLAVHRSAYLAHRDLTKKRLPALAYSEVRDSFEWAQTVIRDYLSAYEGSIQTFKLTNFEKDAARFLEWCRLDDYARHFGEHMERLGMKWRGTEGIL